MCRCGQTLKCFCLPQHKFRLFSGHEPVEAGCLFWDRTKGKRIRLHTVPTKSNLLKKLRARVQGGRLLPLCEHIHYGRVAQETLNFLDRVAEQNPNLKSRIQIARSTHGKEA